MRRLGRQTEANRRTAGRALAGLSQGLVLSFSSSAAAGSLHYFSRFGAERIGAMVLQGASDPQAE